MSNSKTKILFIEPPLLNIMLLLIILPLRKRPTIEPSKFPFSKMSESRCQLLTMFLSSMMSPFILRCPLLKISLKETSKIFTSILKTILRKPLLRKKIRRNHLVQIVEVEDALVVLVILPEYRVMLISADFLTNEFN